MSNDDESHSSEKTNVIKFIKSLNRRLVLIAFGLFLLIGGIGFISYMQYQQYKIANETHIADLYATYNNNMTACKQEADKAKKDVQSNCIKPINDSIVGKWLKARQPSLLIYQ